MASVRGPPPGAGKTSVLTALTDAFSDDDIAHAAVEVETLVWTHPALTEEQWRRQIRLNCRLYRDAGHTLLLLRGLGRGDPDEFRLCRPAGR